LAVRLLGEITKTRLDILRKADDIFIEEIKKCWDFYDKSGRHFAVLLTRAYRTVVVTCGDARELM